MSFFDSSGGTPTREVLVVGGTGMLRPAVHDLAASGARVVVVARRPRRALTGIADTAAVVPVEADWSDPIELAASVKEAVAARPIAEAILWIHSPYAAAMHSELDALLSQTAVVVRLKGSAGADPRVNSAVPDQYGRPRRYREVVLGYADTATGTRWLSDREISDGAMRALQDDAAQQIVGRVEPWSQRP